MKLTKTMQMTPEQVRAKYKYDTRDIPLLEQLSLARAEIKRLDTRIVELNSVIDCMEKQSQFDSIKHAKAQTKRFRMAAA